MGYGGAARQIHALGGGAGITHTVLFAAFNSDYAAANRDVARIVASRPDKFWGFAFVHCERDRGRIQAMVGTAVRDYGFVGIKVHRYDARLTREVCEAGRAFRIPVLYDPIGEVSIVELIAAEYPDVNFIIPHMGSFSDDWRAQHTMIDYLVRHPNIFIDTSGVRRFELLEQAAKRAAPTKFFSVQTVPGCIPASNWRRSRHCGCHRPMKRWFSAVISSSSFRNKSEDRM